MVTHDVEVQSAHTRDDIHIFVSPYGKTSLSDGPEPDPFFFSGQFWFSPNCDGDYRSGIGILFQNDRRIRQLQASLVVTSFRLQP